MELEMESLYLELENYQAENITREYLLSLVTNESVQFTPNEMIESLQRVIAFLSVPGTYMQGLYDME